MSMLIMSYKPSVTNYCRGCVMERYSSQFHTETFDDKEKAIDHIVGLDKALEHMDGEYQHYLIRMEDFIPVRDPEGSWYWDAPPVLMINNNDGNLPEDWQEAIKLKKTPNTK